MPTPSEERMTQLTHRLRQNPGVAASLPGSEGQIVQAALAGCSVYQLAQQQRTSEEAVWRVLGNAARLATGNSPARQVEVGGFGSDTDPGVTGGYGEMGFGSLEADRDPGAVDSKAGANMGDVGSPPR